MRRPVIWLTVAVVVLLAVAAPVFMMNSGSPTQSAGYLPDGHYAKQGWTMLDRQFSLGEANPLQIGDHAPGEHTPEAGTGRSRREREGAGFAHDARNPAWNPTPATERARAD